MIEASCSLTVHTRVCVQECSRRLMIPGCVSGHTHWPTVTRNRRMHSGDLGVRPPRHVRGLGPKTWLPLQLITPFKCWDRPMDHPSPRFFELKDRRSNFPFTQGGVIPADSVCWRAGEEFVWARMCRRQEWWPLRKKDKQLNPCGHLNFKWRLPESTRQDNTARKWELSQKSKETRHYTK